METGTSSSNSSSSSSPTTSGPSLCSIFDLPSGSVGIFCLALRRRWSLQYGKPQHIAPRAENATAQRGDASRIVVRIDRRKELPHIAAVLILQAPVGDHLRRHFQMKLHAVHPIA